MINGSAAPGRHQPLREQIRPQCPRCPPQVTRFRTTNGTTPITLSQLQSSEFKGHGSNVSADV